jgi:acyl carrier protein
MDRAEIEARVKKAVARALKRQEEDISTDANFVFDLGADSMESLQLVAALDEEFDIEMAEDDALNVQTVSEAVDFIKKMLNE